MRFDSNGISQAAHRPATLLHLLRHRGVSQPHQLGYTFLADGEREEASLTYGELDRKARSLGAWLQQLGAARQRVLLLYPPGLDYLAGFFGCLYAGAVAVPVYPPRQNKAMVRLEAVAADAQAILALTTRQTAAKVARIVAQSPVLSGLRWVASEDLAESAEGGWREPEVGADTLAFLQYTSGSTGSPKGVMLTHGNLIHNSALLEAAFEYDEQSEVVSWLPVYHDMGLIGGVLQPLYGGYPCKLMPPIAFLQRPCRWLQAITRYRATISGAPNFAFELCARKVSAEQKATLDLRSWRIAFNGSEPVRAETMTLFAEAFADCGFRREAFFPCYGLAENTLIVSGGVSGRAPIVKAVAAQGLEVNKVIRGPEVAETRLLVSCGRPPLDQQIAIVDPATQVRCAPDEVGEVWVSGRSVAQGYWGRSEESAHTFQAYLADSGEGPFLRTGDMGVLCDGELFITGRLKDLIIIRGLNHYPQDIELTAARCHPALRPGCGAAFGLDVAGEDRLALVHEIDPHLGADPGGLIAQIRRAIAEEHDLQVASIALVKPGAIPKTSSGKLQRYACRKLLLDGALDIVAAWKAAIGTAPGAEVEEEEVRFDSQEAIAGWLASQVARKLGIDRESIDLNQPISSYGLDSLAAIQLAHELESKSGVNLSMVSFLQSFGVADLASEVFRRSHEPLAATSVLSAADKLPTDYPLSKGQQALWFLHRLNPESAAYHIAACVRLRAELDQAALRRTFAGLLTRHPSLRTTFSERGGKPVQRVSERGELAFQVVNATTWTAAALDQFLAEETHRPFDLEHGPLLRVRLLRQSASEHILLLVMHHLIADFWSLSLLLHEMGELYARQQTGSPVMPARVTRNYSDFVEWQAEMLNAPEGQRRWDFWEKQLAGDLPVLNLATDRPRPPVPTYRGASLAFSLNGELTGKLKSLSQAHATTLYTTLLSIFQVLLQRHTGQDDILVGSLTAGRNKAEFADLVGYFVNPVVQRADLAGNPTFAVFLKRNAERVLDVLKHQDYPFPLLVERLQPVRDLSRSPLFQVMFILQKPHLLAEEGLAAFALGEDGARLQLGELALESIAPSQRVAQFDLTLVMAETDGELRASLQYSTDLFNPDTIKRLAERFTILVEGVVGCPGERLSNLPWLTQAERQQLLVEWNDTQADYARGECVHQRFEKCAARTPDAIAVMFEGHSLTYAELNRRANQLAHRLRAEGVAPDTPVGVCFERSLEMMIALLGTLKAGGAYVPLDPALPNDRLSFMLADTQVPVLLTQRRVVASLGALQAAVICLDTDWPEVAIESQDDLRREVSSQNGAYLIYTSGSTGQPKGVVITHGNVVNFFGGMDQAVGCDSRDTLLAATSISFDISVLELLWTLSNGSRVILIAENAIGGRGPAAGRARPNRPLDFSLFYFATDDARQSADERYRLVLEGAKYGDRNGFTAVWTPERHFHAFGGLYPNPSVMGAALAVLTERIGIRAGSVVMPLHSPLRVAEEWALVDNLSKGRVGIAFASGWHADDFVILPENYADRKQAMDRGVETVKRLWRGEAVALKGGAGNEVAVRVYPRPVQPELPFWLTAAGTPETFVKAGEMGANVLTHLLGQSLEEVAEKVRLYRASLARHGFDPRARRVTLMLHTFLGDDRDAVKEQVRGPFTNYLRSSVGLIANFIKSLNLRLDLDTLTPRDMDDLLAYAFDRYYETGALFGTPESCMPMIERVKEMDVDEVACLIDFGIETDSVLAGLDQLTALKARANAEPAYEDYSLSSQAERCGATLMQCTPSMMGMLSLDPDLMESLKSLRALMLGGEALPPKLARQIKETLPARLVNMYGPTETTIWSATHEIAEAGAPVAIGRPIANTQIHILDRSFGLLPGGVEGELCIGGDGVARAYHRRPELCAEKFIPDPFGRQPGARLYRTGDLARRLPDGAIEFLGRLDYQVKVRGHRIELGEIEAVICAHHLVRGAVVLAREDMPGDQRLVAYVVASAALSTGELRDLVREKLPDYMVPTVFMMMPAFPQTPNGKIDRKALPVPDGARPELKSHFVPPDSDFERRIAAIWRQALKVDHVGIHDNFFDIGGHSLLMAQVHSQLRDSFKTDLPLIKILEHPTISGLAGYLSRGEDEQGAARQNHDRALKQREGLKRQRHNLKARFTGQ